MELMHACIPCLSDRVVCMHAYMFCKRDNNACMRARFALSEIESYAKEVTSSPIYDSPTKLNFPGEEYLF